MTKLSNSGAAYAFGEKMDYVQVRDLVGKPIAITQIAAAQSPFDEDKIEYHVTATYYDAAVGFDALAPRFMFTTSHVMIVKQLSALRDEDFPLICQVAVATWASQTKAKTGNFPYILEDVDTVHEEDDTINI